ncbi:MAG: high mobility group box domain-containing protein [Benjaminiella poitrasii]|nr:MAG: high mobility group box domain-containing protein [Benjaminiella poitrasii]
MVIPNDHHVTTNATTSNSTTATTHTALQQQQHHHTIQPSLVDTNSLYTTYQQQKPSYHHLSYSAAAEAAALDSLSFNNNNNSNNNNSHIQEQKALSNTITERKYGESPEKVKRPPNAYLLFNRDMRRHNVNRGLNSGELSKYISQRWKQLTPEQKDHYIKEEYRLKQQHIHANCIYTRRSKVEMMKEASKRHPTPSTTKKKSVVKPKPLPPAQVGGRDPRGRKKRIHDSSLPKHPMSGYLHFAKEMRPSLKQEFPDAGLVEISREIGVRWRSLSAEARQPWHALANEDKDRYAREMKRHLVNQSSLFIDRKTTSLKKAASVVEELDSEVIATVAQMVNPTHR